MNTIYFDIESSPLIGYTFGTYDTNVLDVIKDTELLCFAYKINDGPIEVYSRRTHTERQLVKKLWELFNQADVIVAHNGNKFDIKMSNQFFVKYKLSPPSPYKAVDTLLIARKYFKFTQNKLDYLGKVLLGEGKIHTDMQLWFDCMAGKKDALQLMEEYNIKDVDLLYRVYLKLRGWHNGNPNHNLYNDTSHKCPTCGGNTQRRGFGYTRVSKYQRYQCTGDCKGWSTGERVPLEDKVIR
jgi:DNA polymerase elongation subunit (family B)